MRPGRPRGLWHAEHGPGFALHVAADQAERVAAISKSLGIDAWVAGRVEDGPEQVVIEP